MGIKDWFKTKGPSTAAERREDDSVAIGLALGVPGVFTGSDMGDGDSSERGGDESSDGGGGNAADAGGAGDGGAGTGDSGGGGGGGG